MTITANIIRPQVESNFTALPNSLYELARHVDGLKPRDISVLNYLLSKPAQWKLQSKDISNALNICERTVRDALKVLQYHGFASYTREKTGETNWKISVPENLYSQAIKPQCKKPNGEKPHGEKCNAILKNKTSLTKKEKATNVTVSNDFVKKAENAPIGSTHDLIKIDINELTPVETEIVKKELSSVEPTEQLKIVTILKEALAKKNVKSPVAYTKKLIQLSRVGNLESPTPQPLPPANNEPQKNYSVGKSITDEMCSEIAEKHGVTGKISAAEMLKIADELTTKEKNTPEKTKELFKNQLDRIILRVGEKSQAARLAEEKAIKILLESKENFDPVSAKIKAGVLAA